MKIYFNGNNVELNAGPTTNLTKKQIESIKIYAKKYIKELINQNKIK
jgi:hypothetical protein